MKQRRLWIRVLALGAAIASLLVAMQLLRYSFLLRDWSVELYLLAAGVPLLVAGVLAGRWMVVHKGAGSIDSRPPPLRSPLTARELEILAHVSRGMSNQEIADRLFVSVTTVKTHLRNIYGKLDVKRRTQAVDRARRLELIR